MKKLIILILFIFSTIIAQDITKDLKTLQYKTDEFTDITTYTPYISTPNLSTMYFYMVANKSGIYDGRIVIQYYGKDWIFFDEMTVICNSDKNSYTFSDLYYTKEILKDGYILEKYDFSIERYSFFRELLNNISKSKTVKIRFSGKRFELLSDKSTDTKFDFQLNNNQLFIIKQYFSLYNKYFPIDTLAFNTNIGFKLFKWGDSKDRVKSKENLKYNDISWVDKNQIAYDCRILGYDATLWYKFDETNTLLEADYIFSVKDKYDIQYKSIYNSLLRDVLSNKEHEIIDAKEKYIGRDLYLTSSWKTENTIIDIMVVVIDKDSKLLCSITFKPILSTKNKPKS